MTTKERWEENDNTAITRAHWRKKNVNKGDHSFITFLSSHTHSPIYRSPSKIHISKIGSISNFLLILFPYLLLFIPILLTLPSPSLFSLQFHFFSLYNLLLHTFTHTILPIQFYPHTSTHTFIIRYFINTT
jgi:hypothetical protein